MKLKEKGRYFELPIDGLKIKEIVFSGMLKLIFNDNEESYLDLHSSFKVTQYSQTKEISQRGKDALILFFDHFDQLIKEAKADKYGNLWLSFINGTEIHVEDGPYENWHYTKKITDKPFDSLHVYGGVGRTTY